MKHFFERGKRVGMKGLIFILSVVSYASLVAFFNLFTGAEENLPVPITGYPKRNVPIMGDAWSKAGGRIL